MLFNFRSTFACCLLLPGISAPCLAQIVIDPEANESSAQQATTLETGILQNLVGYKDDVLGALVIKITAGEDSVSEVIEISIPVNPELVDRVSVVSESGTALKFLEPMKISLDHAGSKVGIILTLSGNSRIRFKIKMVDLPDE